MVNDLKFRTPFSFCSQLNCWLSGMLVRIANIEDPDQQTVKTLIRLLLQKQSDLGLHCLPMPFPQATSVRNFRTCTVSSYTI